MADSRKIRALEAAIAKTLAQIKSGKYPSNSKKLHALQARLAKLEKELLSLTTPVPPPPVNPVPPTGGPL